MNTQSKNSIFPLQVFVNVILKVLYFPNIEIKEFGENVGH